MYNANIKKVRYVFVVDIMALEGIYEQRIREFSRGRRANASERLEFSMTETEIADD